MPFNLTLTLWQCHCRWHQTSSCSRQRGQWHCCIAPGFPVEFQWASMNAACIFYGVCWLPVEMTCNLHQQWPPAPLLCTGKSRQKGWLSLRWFLDSSAGAYQHRTANSNYSDSLNHRCAYLEVHFNQVGSWYHSFAGLLCIWYPVCEQNDSEWKDHMASM